MPDLERNETLAVQDKGSGPGVLVLHAWWGLNDFMRQVCERLAGEGYVALAPDLYHGKVATTIAEAEKLGGQLDADAARAQAEIAAALDRLLHLPATEGERTGVIGFSLGAYYALWLADHRPEDVAALVVFYGTSGDLFQKMQAACQGHFAERDPFEPPEGVQQVYERLRAAGRDVTFYTYPGTGHWFFEQDRPDAYDPEAAELAWQRTVEFLQKTLKQV
jgi:carboxymethylenebutenolidase